MCLKGRASIQRHRTLSSVLARSACYKRILFYAKAGDRDSGTLFQLAWKGLPRKEKRIKRLRSCPANRKTALASYNPLSHFRAESGCSLCSQAEKRNFFPSSCRGRGLLLFPVTASDKNRIISVEDGKAAACASISHRTKCRVVAAAGYSELYCCPKQGCALGRGKLITLALPMQRAASPGRQAGALWD